MRADRPSITASLVAAVRAIYTALPPPYNLAPDPHAEALLPAVFAIPARAVGRAPAWAAPAVHRLVGAASFGLSDNVALRTPAIDDALREGIEGGATQLVILGAGLDARTARMGELAGVRAFEVDYPSTHRFKMDRYTRSGVHPKAREVVRVTIDFERDRLDEVLLAEGFDPAQRSFWIWEGVTVYLTRAAVAGTLAVVGRISAPGSRIALTYTRPSGRHGPAWFMPVARRIAGAFGEPVRGMMETAELGEHLADVGFRPISDESALEWSRRYWPEEEPIDEWERLAVAERVAPGEAGVSLAG